MVSILDKDSIGKRVLLRRKKAGLTQTELAKLIHVGKSTISIWENDEAEPKLTHFKDLAKALGAATACSRPVADIGWRPHHEHVGQTGVAIRPNLYIAVGISGAIQHLAGVNGSKVIVVVNTDTEAPFFKAADYGVVGDAFEVIPRLTEAVKRFKATQH